MKDIDMNAAAILSRVDIASITSGKPPQEWTRLNGAQLTPDELDVVLNAEAAEWEAASALMKLRLAALESSTAVLQELRQVAEPYFAAGCQNLGEVSAAINERGTIAERITFNESVRILHPLEGGAAR